MPSTDFIKYFFRSYLASLFVLLGLAILKFRNGLYAEDLDPASLAIMLGILLGLIGLPLGRLCLPELSHTHPRHPSVPSPAGNSAPVSGHSG